MTKGQQVHKLNEAIALLGMIPALDPDSADEVRKDAIAILDDMVKAIAGTITIDR